MAKLTEDGVLGQLKALKSRPYINWAYDAGPAMLWGGRIHYLTRTERVCLRLRITTIDAIAATRFSYFRDWHPAGRAALSQAGDGR